MRSCLLVLLLLSGCAPTSAVVDGKSVARLDMDFVGQPFVVRVSAAHPKPGSPSGGLRDFGGRISGNICGLDVTYDVQHEGTRTRLTGFVDEKQTDSRLEVRDVDGVSRQISGSLDSESGTAVNLDVRKNAIRGNIGLRTFDLGRDGDRYIGSVKVVGMTTAATINGADDLWTLPPAAQAVVLPALLTCYGDELEQNKRGAFVVGFGGRQTWEGKHVSAIYHAQTGDVQRAIMQGSQGSTVGH
ncbi:MAG: hypothetical protein LC659_00935 [Myxococcales bacterium]|nr:hypothetical protein [Myxococcales bacterium]